MQKAWALMGVFLALPVGAQTVTTTQSTPSGGTITTTRKIPNYARRDEIENGIDNGVDAGIALYERHQALVTLHNEERHEFEGLYQSDYDDLDSLVLVGVPQIAVLTSSPHLRGQSLRETWQQFVSKNPKLQANVAKCIAAPPVKETKKHQVFDRCADVRYMQQNQDGNITMTCRNADFMVKDVMCSDFDGEVVFVDGKLAIYKYRDSTHWKNEFAGLEDVFGPPSGMDKNNTSAIWRTPEYSVAAEQVDGGVSAVWETAAQFTHAQAEQKQVESSDE
jgi:hypothetical protein